MKRLWQTMSHRNLILLGLASLVAGTVFAQTPPVSSEIATEVKPSVKQNNRWLMICCGLPGDDEHRERLTSACEQLVSASESTLGVSADRLKILVGDDKMQTALQSSASEIGVCTKETIQQTVQTLCDSVEPNDSCWIMILGHAHLYGNRSQFNIQGSDIDQTMFAKMLKPLSCREQVVWVTTPVSGFWIKPLSQKNRVIVSATEPDLEFTGTEMPYALGDLLVGEGEEAELSDVDGDGKLSLLDLYLATNLEIHGRFVSMERLQTEHSQLDDNADGRGSEVQEPYLPEPEEEPEEEEDDDEVSEEKDESTAESEETPPETKPLPVLITNANVDGFLSRHIYINPPKQ